MTILAENIGNHPQMCWGAGVPWDNPCPPKVVARDVFCPDGHHLMTQEWSLTELRQLLDTNSPVFFLRKARLPVESGRPGTGSPAAVN
jgi:hypothetical protein